MKKEFYKRPIYFDERNTQIVDSYNLNNNEIEEVVQFIIKYRKSEKMSQTRTKQSCINEIKAHNRLYKLHISRSHTKDCDLEENINPLYETIYKAIGV